VIGATRIARQRVVGRHVVTPPAPPANGIAAASKGVSITMITSGPTALA
jgi:hypothetical protein